MNARRRRLRRCKVPVHHVLGIYHTCGQTCMGSRKVCNYHWEAGYR